MVKNNQIGMLCELGFRVCSNFLKGFNYLNYTIFIVNLKSLTKCFGIKIFVEPLE